MPNPSIMPFAEALQQLRGKNLLPTELSSAELQQLQASVMRTSFTSARTTLEDLLDSYKTNIEKIINPTQERRADRVTPENPEGFTTVGMDQATARLEAKKELQRLGYQPDPNLRGTVQDLSSDARVNLVIKTNVETTQGAGHFIQGNMEGVIDAFPCWELVRFEGRVKGRDWPTRFKAAALASGDTDALRVLDATGRMVARKDSGIWQALGDGAGGYTDNLGNPFPPFAFNSGMWVQDVSQAEAESLGIPVQGMRPQELELGNIFERKAA